MAHPRVIPAQGAVYYTNCTYSFQKEHFFFFSSEWMKERGMAADFEGLENNVLDGIL